MPTSYFLPLGAAIIYALASILLKRAIGSGDGVTRVFFLTHIVMAACFIPFIFLFPPRDWGYLWVPITVGTISFAGALSNFVALRLGDVSVINPVLGTKVVFVAAASVILLPGAIPLAWWLAAGLTVAALWLLNFSRRGSRPAHLSATIGLSLVSAACFGIGDVIIQRWAADFGRESFVGFSLATNGLLSVCVVPFFRKPLGELGIQRITIAVIAALLIAVQLAAVFYAISTYGDATAMNVLYASRGIWSIVLVWSLGSWLGSLDTAVDRATLLRRLGGAILLLAAIFLVVRTGPSTG